MIEIAIEEAGYEHNEPTIKKINFTIQKGEMIGLIGENGTGKSTTIKGILGLLPFFKGDIQFGEEKPNYAYIPEQPIYYEYLTLWEHIELLAAAKDMNREIWEDEANRLLKIYRMTEVKHHYLNSFSKGMKQKVMLILSMLTKPDFYIIDEPFVGLDPRAIKEFLTMLKIEKERGSAILICTHVLDTAERICDQFVILSKGSIVVKGTLTAIQKHCNLPESSLLDCFDMILEREG